MPSERELTLLPEDVLSRYATQSNQFNSFGVTPKLFMPPKDLKLSVFCTTRLPIAEIQRIGQDNLPLSKIYGHGDSVVSFIESTGLMIDFDNQPERHANITGWPEVKDEQKLLAQKLAREINRVSTFSQYLTPIEPSSGH